MPPQPSLDSTPDSRPARASRRSPLLHATVDALLLLLILGVAAGFRFNGLDWDQGTHQHPDERFLTEVATQVHSPASLGEYFATLESPLNPYARGFDRYAYGQLPLTLTRLVAERVQMTDYGSVYLVGRVLSILASLATIVFTWLLARRALGRRHAHLAAALLAVTVLDIQLAHFFAVDTFATCFAVAGLFFGQRAWQRRSTLDAALAGAMAGLATASKISAVALLGVLVVAFLWPRRPRWTREDVADGLVAGGVALLAALVTLRVAEPYAFMGPSPWSVRPNLQWVLDKAYWAQVSSGGVDVPYMIQWAGTTPFAFSIQAIVQWGMGPGLGVAAFVGLGVAAWRLLKGETRERELLLVLGWTVLNLAYFGGQFAKFLRYLEPIYPTLAILAAYALIGLADWARGLPRERGRGRVRLARVAAALAAVAVAGATAGWAVAFSHVYAVPHSRVQASQWIYASIPAGRTLATEHWDDRLPLQLPLASTTAYHYVELPLYDPDTDAKRQKLQAALDQADYVILASDRLEGSIPRLPERYPLGTAYYQDLNDGALGFHLARRFDVTPEIGGVSIDDSHAQEDFTVYDHPVVEIWEKDASYSSARVRDLLGAVDVASAVYVKPADGGKRALLMSPAERQAAERGATWSTLFDPGSLTNRAPLFVWLLTLEAFALAAAPLLWRTLPRVPDRGFGASKVLGLALASYLVWIAASLHLVSFSRWSVAGAWGVVLLLSIAAVWPRRADFWRWLSSESRLLWVEEGVFLVGFGLFLFIRAANPDLWHPVFGGEKPMNFAFLNAVVRSEWFPPYDPWFAGGIVNYYYFGLVLVAVPIKLTGVLPEVAFNLAEPTLYGALCATAFSLAFGLLVPRGGSLRRAPAYVAGLCGVLFVAVLGNLDAGLQLASQLWRLGGIAAPDSGGIARLAAGLLSVAAGARFPPLDFWASTRLIGPEDPGPITEFPYFTWLYGDLHAHQIALPLATASLVVVLSALRSARAEPGRVPWGAVGWLGLLLGMLRVTNTWDLPTYAGVATFGLGLGFLPAVFRARRGSLPALVVSLAAIAVLSQALFWPYVERYQLFYTGVDPSKPKTALAQYLTIHGLFLWTIGGLIAWYAVLAWRAATATQRARQLVPQHGYFAVFGPALPPAALRLTSAAGWVVAIGLGLSLGLLALRDATAAFVVAAAALAGAASIALWRRPSRSFHMGLVVAGLLVTLAPEFVALKGDIGRMNTVFKLYFQAWLLLAIAAAASVGWLSGRPWADRAFRGWRIGWVGVTALLVFAGLSYPLFASEAKVGLRFAALPLALDGMAYMDVARYQDRGQDLNLPGDAQAIRWLRANVQGSPPILEGRAGIYHWGSRISIYTGLPTVLGWDWHEEQQRAGYVAMVQARANDVQRAYDSPNPADAKSVLDKYGVRWVYIGGLERATYSAAGLAKFPAMPQLRLAYNQNGVQIYEVLT